MQDARHMQEEKIATLTRRVTFLETELSKNHERAMEVEGRMDSQREFVESVSQSLNKVREERDAMLERKGALESELRALTTARDEALQRCRESDERLAEARAAAHEAMEGASRSSLEQLSARDAELQTARDRRGMGALCMRGSGELDGEGFWPGDGSDCRVIDGAREGLRSHDELVKGCRVEGTQAVDVTFRAVHVGRVCSGD